MSTLGLVAVVLAVVVGFEALRLIASTKAGGANAAVASGSGSASGVASTVGVVPSGSWVGDAVNWSHANNIDPRFLLSIIAQEGPAGAASHRYIPPNSGIPGESPNGEDSWGWLQLDLNQHSPAGAGASYAANKACAQDLLCALNYWGGHIKGGYDAGGGGASFLKNPKAFLLATVYQIQGSFRWTDANATNALSQADHWLAGWSNPVGGGTNVQ